jgi:hypothetical protein
MVGLAPHTFLGDELPRRLQTQPDLFQDCPRIAQERAPGIGQLYAAVCPQQQFAPDLALELLDRERQWRLRDVEPPGRPVKVQLLGQCHEVTQLAQVH